MIAFDACLPSGCKDNFEEDNIGDKTAQTANREAKEFVCWLVA